MGLMSRQFHIFLPICLGPTVGSVLRRGIRQIKARRKNSRLALPSFSKEP